MYALLKSRNENPVTKHSSGGSDSSTTRFKPEISPVLRRKLLYMHLTSFDWERGGLRTPVKFLDRDSIEYCLLQASHHDRTEEKMARLTLDAGLALIDPVWGGIYQFSTQHDWYHPHYSKSMAAQAGCLRIYSLAYALLHELRYLTAARQIFNFMKEFLLNPDGIFYCGQDDTVQGIEPREYFALPHSQRLRYGKPAIDINLTARDNGWAVEALATFYEFSGEDSALELAVQATEWLLNSCRLGKEGFRHAITDQVSLLLADNLAVGRAMLQLYRVTNESRYLVHACETADFIGNQFRADQGGFNTRRQNAYGGFSSQQIDENISVTRFLNLLSFYAENARYRKMALHGLRYLTIPQVATARMEEAGILLADEELTSEPVTITIAGQKTDTKARKLYQTTLRAFGWYKVVNWKGPGARVCNSHKIENAFACISNEYYQSGPVYQPEKLSWLIKSI